MKRKIVLPWRYLVMLVVGLAALWLLIWRFGRTDVVLIGWLITWLFVSRGVDFLMRRKRRRRFEDEEGA
jgi:fatty acid desaturase